MNYAPHKNFDLDEIMGELESAEMTVQNPINGDSVIGVDGKPWTITFAGHTHPKTVALRQLNMKRMLKNVQVDSEMGDTVEQIDAREIEALVERTLGWSPVIRKGKEFEFSPENARFMYEDARWLIKQATRFLSTDANFLSKSKPA